jgi:hypothetical protein
LSEAVDVDNESIAVKDPWMVLSKPLTIIIINKKYTPASPLELLRKLTLKFPLSRVRECISLGLSPW